MDDRPKWVSQIDYSSMRYLNADLVYLCINLGPVY